MLAVEKPQVRPLTAERPTVPANALRLDTVIVDVAVEVPAFDTRAVGLAVTLNKGVLTV
jgi:hypothetical protein